MRKEVHIGNMADLWHLSHSWQQWRRQSGESVIIASAEWYSAHPMVCWIWIFENMRGTSRISLHCDDVTGKCVRSPTYMYVWRSFSDLVLISRMQKSYLTSLSCPIYAYEIGRQSITPKHQLFVDVGINVNIGIDLRWFLTWWDWTQWMFCFSSTHAELTAVTSTNCKCTVSGKRKLFALSSIHQCKV